MSRENELLSIGEVAKLTGVSVQALRYYERKNIVEPAYVSPDSGYRYYSPGQIYFIQLIINCVNLDIPLKELAGVFNTENMSGFRNFFERNKEIAERKAKIITSSIHSYKAVLEKMELTSLYKLGEIYSREYPQKIYYLNPHNQPLKGESRLKLFLEIAPEIYGENFNSITIDDDPDELFLVDIGVIAQYSSIPVESVDYFVIGEVTKQMATDNCLYVPAGTYFFRQDENSQLENAPEIFKEHLAHVDKFIIIETEEPFLSKTKINQPVYELRLVVL